MTKKSIVDMKMFSMNKCDAVAAAIIRHRWPTDCVGVTAPASEDGRNRIKKTLGRIEDMNVSTKFALAGTTAFFTAATAASAMTIGITQNNVGVDSYQTTYEQAFIAAAEANPDVDVVVLDAGGDVARQIAQMEDLIPQEVDALIIRPTFRSSLPTPTSPSRASISSPPSRALTTSPRGRVRPRSCATGSPSSASRTRRASCRSQASRATRRPSSVPRGSRIVCPKFART